MVQIIIISTVISFIIVALNDMIEISKQEKKFKELENKITNNNNNNNKGEQI